MLKVTEAKKYTAVFYLTAAVMMLWNLGVNPLWGSEDRWAEIARSMCISGDWLHPAINGNIYFDKPLLTYWPIALLSIICGCINEFIVRLPSVLAAFLGLWSTRDLARRVTGCEKTVNYAGWLLLSAYGFFFWGRSAAAEMMNLAMIALAADWFFIYRDRAKFGGYLVFWLICFIGAWAKGTPALIVPAAIAITWSIAGGTWKKHFNFKHIGAFLLAAAVGSVPYVLAAMLPPPEYYTQPQHGLDGLGLFWRENIVRAIKPFDHDDEPFYIYLLHIPRIMIPWSLLVIAALVANIKEWRDLSWQRRWIWLAAAAIFVLFSASRSRRWYYILPIMPFLAIAAASWISNAERWSEQLRKFYWYMLTIISWVALIGGLIALAALRHWPDAWQILMRMGPAMPVMVLALAAACIMTLRKQRNWNGVIAGGVMVIAAVFSVIYPATGKVRTEKPFALALKKQLPAEVTHDQVILLGNRKAVLSFYLQYDRPIVITRNVKELKEHLDKNAGKTFYIIVDSRRRTIKAFQEAFPHIAAMPPFVKEESIKLVTSPKKARLACWKYQVPEKTVQK